ncbi:TonB-dependent receptor plug domain-containing protein [Desulfogranum mediterraneum]|uniref:TonB-dependent receptor plug domain-containing protein n=1 Tax=Desulfogranum mediterraneum TaxID=160661 RepID=UPI00041D7B73|nr:TonB-dependent receptor [Desulfogranum mediterraneum]
MVGNYCTQKTRHALLLVPLFLAATSAIGQEQPIQEDTLTVTAERFPVEEKGSPRFITVVSSEQLEESGANTLVDGLRRSGGFGYTAFAPLGISHGGMNSTLPIRGVKDGELVLVNGVPVQGAAGHAYDLNTIPIDQIERVEILKGAASTLYGADAMSGVINIITKKTQEESAVQGSVEFGNEGYQNHSISAVMPGVNIGFNYQHLDALDEISRSFSRKYHYDLDNTDKYGWNVNARILDHLYLDYLGSYYTTGFHKYYDRNSKADEGTNQDAIKHFLDLRYETDSFRAKAFGLYDEMQRDEYTALDEPEDTNKNYNFGLEGDYKVELSDWAFNLGGDWTYRGADYNNKYGEHHRNDYALFMQVKKTFWDQFTATLGAREQFIDGESGTADYDRFLPSLGLVYQATANLNLFANAGKAFRAPTFNNLYYRSSFIIGNPELGPEEGWTYEAGVKYDNPMLRLRLALFSMQYEDKIEIDRSAGYPNTYFNATDYESTGIEWDLGISPFVQQGGWAEDLSLRLAGYWADPTAEDTSGAEYQTGAKLQTSVGLNYLTEPLTMDLNCQLLSSRERNLDSSTIVNFYAKYRLWKGYLTFGVDNIFDDEVQVSGNLLEDASNQYLYYGVGRLVKLGYSLSF